MITHPGNPDTRIFQLLLGRSKCIQAITNFDPDMIQPTPPSGRWARRIAHFDQQQFMMGPSGRQRGGLSIKDSSDFPKPHDIPVKGQGGFQILHIEHDMS